MLSLRMVLFTEPLKSVRSDPRAKKNLGLKPEHSLKGLTSIEIKQKNKGLYTPKSLIKKCKANEIFLRL